MKRSIRFLALAVLTGASALAQDAVVTRSGDGAVMVPTRGGVVTVTVTTHASSTRIPRRGVRLNEKQLDRFLRDRTGRANEWT